MDNRKILFATLAFVLVAPAAASGDTAAARNRDGNRLFAQRKFSEAERAYVDAQAKAPGRAELLYNHGNALVRQKKYEPALQQLRQAAAKGNHGLQASAWFNAGNALYEMGNFSNAAQAFIEALKINPADRDAKHNLELALQKEREKQNQSSQGNKQDDPSNAGQQQPDKQDGQGRQANPQAGASRPEAERNKPANPQATRADRRDAGFSKDQAIHILDALQNQELVEQKKRLERMARRKAVGKDW